MQMSFHFFFLQFRYIFDFLDFTLLQLSLMAYPEFVDVAGAAVAAANSRRRIHCLYCQLSKCRVGYWVHRPPY